MKGTLQELAQEKIIIVAHRGYLAVIFPAITLLPMTLPSSTARI